MTAAAHFMLDPTRGDVTFGDGEHGRTPLAGSLLVRLEKATAIPAPELMQDLARRYMS